MADDTRGDAMSAISIKAAMALGFAKDYTQRKDIVDEAVSQSSDNLREEVANLVGYNSELTAKFNTLLLDNSRLEDARNAAQAERDTAEAEVSSLRGALESLKDKLNSEEHTMKHWDMWREIIEDKSYKGATLPRDMFESWRDCLVEDIEAALRGMSDDKIRPEARSALPAAGKDEIYLIRRHGAWFRPEARGYTTDLASAGHYMKAEAEKYLDVEGLTIHPASSLIDDLLTERDRIRRNLNRINATIHVLSLRSEAQQPSKARPQPHDD